ncbi:MAG: hypothetical protein R3321_07205 [Nitrososphaeraceae archaeon]|nr:hypothetical protein [Nitrososphaeraceae archaeon]
MADPDRRTTIDGDQITDGTVSPEELATTNQEISQDPLPDEVLHGHSSSGSDKKLQFKRAEALNVDVDTSNFDNALTINEDTVQKALDKLDDIVGTFIAGIKEIVFRPERVNNVGDYKVKKLGQGATEYFTFYVPQDFNELIQIDFVFVPDNTIASGKTVSLDSDYAQVGQNAFTNSESLSNVPITGVANIITLLEISGVYTQLTARNFCGFKLNLNNIGTTINSLGIRLRYR